MPRGGCQICLCFELFQFYHSALNSFCINIFINDNLIGRLVARFYYLNFLGQFFSFAIALSNRVTLSHSSL